MTVINRYKPIILDFFAGVGCYFTVAEILSVEALFNTDIGYTIIRSFWSIPIAAFILFIAVWKNWIGIKYSCSIANTDVKITLQIGNIFDGDGAIIIPVNTSFDTSTADGTVKTHSIQGQFQELYFKRKIEKLNEQIKYGLKNIDMYYSGERNLYPIGTTCKVIAGNKQFYLLAAANSNVHGNLSVTPSEISSALTSLWKNIHIIGDGETLLIPLIWTGRAGIQDAQRDKITREIISSFVAATYNIKPTEKLIIYINPTDIINKTIDWNSICDYLKYVCTFYPV